jgi:hypothetical protein
MFDFPFHWYVFMAVAVALATLPYWAGPLLIKFTLVQSAEPEFEPLSLQSRSLPRMVVDHFHEVTAELEPLGFEVVEALAMPYQVRNVKAMLLLFSHAKNKDAALASAIYAEHWPEQAPVAGRALKTFYVEFISRFRDGALFQTQNSDQLSAFAPVAGRTTFRLPMVEEPARLYRLHQALVERERNSSGKILRVEEEFKGDAAAYLAAGVVEELEGQVETGYFYRAPDGSSYRPTWKGVFIMTWQELWPFKAIRRARRDRKARQLLAELEE